MPFEPNTDQEITAQIKGFHILFENCVAIHKMDVSNEFLLRAFPSSKTCQSFSILTKQHPLVYNTITFFGLGISDTSTVMPYIQLLRLYTCYVLGGRPDSNSQSFMQ